MRDTTRAYLALTFTVLAWGMSFVATKAALESFTPFVLVFLRFAGASLVFALLLRGRFPRLRPADHGRFLLLAGFEPVLYFIFETYGLTLTTASEASIIIAAVPIAVAIVARVFLKEPIEVRTAVAILASIAGIVVLIVGDPGTELEVSGSVAGNLLMIGAVVAAAFYTVLARSLGRRWTARQITGLQAMYGSGLLLPFFLATAGNTAWENIAAPALGALIFLTFFATIGAFLTYNFSLKILPAGKAAIFINGIPVVATIGGWILLGERLSGWEFLGAGLVILAAYLAVTAGRRPPCVPRASQR
jgi:drug/metabolite transporter (DMT)-like permease